jgi:hypothetical protein
MLPSISRERWLVLALNIFKILDCFPKCNPFLRGVYGLALKKYSWSYMENSVTFKSQTKQPHILCLFR